MLIVVYDTLTNSFCRLEVHGFNIHSASFNVSKNISA